MATVAAAAAAAEQQYWLITVEQSRMPTHRSLCLKTAEAFSTISFDIYYWQIAISLLHIFHSKNANKSHRIGCSFVVSMVFFVLADHESGRISKRAYLEFVLQPNRN